MWKLIHLKNTLQTVGCNIAYQSPNLTTVTLPDTVTEVGAAFLDASDRVVKVSGSLTAVVRAHSGAFR